MKRLFMLRTRKRGLPITENNKTVYFESKVEAKKMRNDLRNKGFWPDCVVSFGPDHRLFTGE